MVPPNNDHSGYEAYEISPHSHCYSEVLAAVPVVVAAMDNNDWEEPIHWVVGEDHRWGPSLGANGDGLDVAL